MRTNLSSGLLSLLNSGAKTYVRADLYTFTLQSGTVLYYTNVDQDLTVGGNTFSHLGPVFTRDGMKLKAGTEVQEMAVTMDIPTSLLLSGTPFLQALRNGALDFAQFRLDLFISDTFADVSNGAINYWFSGKVASIDIGRQRAVATIKNDMNLLGIQMPRNLFQAGCVHTLFDGGCTLSKASYAVNGAVASSPVPSKSLFYSSSLAQPSGYFSLGTIVFTSGVNNGVKRGIQTYANGAPSALYMDIPLVQAPSAGDTFTVYPGCDKTMNTCANTYGNLVNFKGFPYVPAPETATA